MNGYWNIRPTNTNQHTLWLLACDPLAVVIVTSEIVAESWVDGAVVVQSTVQSAGQGTAMRWN